MLRCFRSPSGLRSSARQIFSCQRTRKKSCITKRNQSHYRTELHRTEFLGSFGISMVGLGGLEPPTSPLSGVRSSHLSYRPGYFRTGGAGRDRTGDLLNANQALSQLSYSPLIKYLSGFYSAIIAPDFRRSLLEALRG